MTIWNDRNVETLKRLWGEGLSCSAIARRIDGATRSAVIGKVFRLKLPGRLPRKPFVPPRKAVAKPRVSAAVCRPKIVAEPIPPPVDGDIGRVSFADLKPGMCRFIPGDPKAGGKLFCGCETVPGLSYCANHAQRCFQAPHVAKRDPEAARTIHKFKEFA